MNLTPDWQKIRKLQRHLFSTNMNFARLQDFRQEAYNYLVRARDATFELTDAVLLTRHAYSLADLSLCPVFRRNWPSLYEALQDTRPQRNKLMRLYIEHIPTDSRPILAGDHTGWLRPDAVTLQERTTEHSCTEIYGNRPIGIGQGYSTLAWIPEKSGSWALPLRHERITSWESPISKAVWQLKQVCHYLPVRPITIWDSEYGCAPFVLKTADIAADKLMRLRSNLCLFNAPPPYSGKGRPRIHGTKFKLNDSTTWQTPAVMQELDDPQQGRVRIQLWYDLHFPAAANQTMCIIRVERLNNKGAIRVFKPLWLAWIGEHMPPLSEIWHIYLRRFGVDHWYRFAKQRLHWTLPKLSTKQQCERWSDLMPLMTWELWLAREGVQDQPLPWQKKCVQLTPGRVAQGMGGVLARIGTPASPPKPRGKSPGWPIGKSRTPKLRYPIVKKGFSRAKNTKKTANNSD